MILYRKALFKILMGHMFLTLLILCLGLLMFRLVHLHLSLLNTFLALYVFLLLPCFITCPVKDTSICCLVNFAKMP